jgi:hypothetical protein
LVTLVVGSYLCNCTPIHLSSPSIFKLQLPLNNIQPKLQYPSKIVSSKLIAICQLLINNGPQPLYHMGVKFSSLLQNSILGSLLHFWWREYYICRFQNDNNMILNEKIFKHKKSIIISKGGIFVISGTWYLYGIMLVLHFVSHNTSSCPHMKIQCYLHGPFCITNYGIDN